MLSIDDSESFVRWQGITITQLTYSVNMVLGLSTASLGFDVTLLMNKEFVPESWQQFMFAAAFLALLLSIAIGIWCIVNRLLDFRLTMWATRDRDKDPARAAINRAVANSLGKKTWALF